MKKEILSFIRRLIGTDKFAFVNDKARFYYFESRRFQLIEHILHDTESGITDEKYTDHEIIVSLTSYGKRIDDVTLTIESLMQQTMKSNRIILWLDESFKDTKLPQSLIYQQKRGLEIQYCKDIRSYKKLIPCLQQFPNDAIITVDDDLLYDYDIIEKLITAYQKSPQMIHACRVHRMILDQEYKPIPYLEWNWRIDEVGVNRLNFFTGGAGTLYPPGCLDKEVFNENVFLDICKFADDVWFNAMAIKKGTLVNKVGTRSHIGEDYIMNEGVQNDGLWVSHNKVDSLIDTQIKAVFDKYDLYGKLI